MKHSRIAPHFVVKKGIHGIGVFAKKGFKKGTILFKLKGDVLDHPTRTSVQIGKHDHIEDYTAGHMNHSCHPNAKVLKRLHAFVTLKNITKGEEITFNYNANEDNLANPFKCECCGRKICGRKKLK